MFCNLCGRDYARLNKAEVEGAIVDACDKCARFGRVLESVQEYKSVIGFQMDVAEIAANYGEMIRQYRESHGMTREEFAQRLSEKISVIKRLEEESMEPDDKLLKKVQGLMRVKLAENYRTKSMRMKA